jgi:hypothetical protein
MIPEEILIVLIFYNREEDVSNWLNGYKKGYCMDYNFVLIVQAQDKEFLSQLDGGDSH